MVIYKITCSKTNKIYIGQSKRSAQIRFDEHIHAALYSSLDTHLCRAIRKYGQESFSFEVIDTATNEKELTDKEYYWINFYHSAEPGIGYNETIDKNKCGGNTYRNKDENDMKIIRSKISSKLLGSGNGMAKPVKAKNIKTGEILHFGSTARARDYFKQSGDDFVRNRCNNYTYAWKDTWLFAWETDDFKDVKFYDPATKKGIKVILTNIETNEIKQVNSKNQAARFLQINENKIKNNVIINNYRINF